MHLRGMYTILRMHDVEGPQKHQERGAFRAHLFEVMGIMDLPTFSIGRRHPHLGFWRRYCCKGKSPAEIETGVEVVTGLPKHRGLEVNESGKFGARRVSRLYGRRSKMKKLAHIQECSGFSPWGVAGLGEDGFLVLTHW